MSVPVIQDNRGGLDKDSDPCYINNGDYPDAKNITSVTIDGGTSKMHENVVGNKLAFNLGSISPSNKKYRISGFGAISDQDTGWNYFGANLTSRSFTGVQSTNPHIIEDTINPGNLYLFSGDKVWYYNSGTSDWTEKPAMVIDGIDKYRTPFVAMSPTGALACIYTKDFGSGQRYVIRKWNAGTLHWDFLCNSSTGFEAADGYTYGNHPTNPYAAYYDPYLLYNGSTLYMYVVGCYQNPSATDLIYQSSSELPRVFRYNGSTWNDFMSDTADWGGYDRLDGYWTSASTRVKLGKPILSSYGMLFPMVRQNISGSDYLLTPYVARHNGTIWDSYMTFNAFDAISGGRSVISNIDNSYTRNSSSWAEPCIEESASSGDIILSFGAKVSAPLDINNFYAFRSIAGGSAWGAYLHGPSLNSFGIASSYNGGKCAIGIDATNNLIVAFPDKNASSRISVVKSNIGSSSWLDMDNPGLSEASCYSGELDIVYSASDNEFYIGYSDYENASNFTKPIGVPSVKKYIGGGGYFQDFKITYSNGLEIAEWASVSNINTLIAEISSSIDTSKYQIYITYGFDEYGFYYLDFSIYPIVNLNAYIGFDYYITTEGAFTVNVISEPIPTPYSGPIEVIGSARVGEDLFILGTPNKYEIGDTIKSYPAYEIVSGVSGIEFKLSKGTGIIDGGLCILSNDQSLIEFSGTHLCSVDTSNQLYDLVVIAGYFQSIPSGLEIKISPTSIGNGNVFHAIKNENNGVWSSVRLISSNEFNWSTIHQVDVIAEKNTRGVSIYYTDNNNPIGVLYYYGEYINDGALNSVNPLNKYILGKIKEQTQLQKQSSGAVIKYNGQGPGGLKCGNYRYSVRFSTKEGVFTGWSLLSNPISAIINNSTPERIRGGSPDEISGKSNKIEVSWPSSGIYDYIEVCFVRSISDSIANSLLQATQTVKFYREKLSKDQLSVLIEHTGFEVNQEEGDFISELSSIPFLIRKAKNIRALDNRLVVSNVDVSSPLNGLQDLFTRFTYSVEKKAIPTIGTFSPEASLYQRINGTTQTLYPAKELTTAEYTDPSNIFNYMGYMMKERYRLYAVVEFMTNEMSDAFHLFDVTINTDEDAIAENNGDLSSDLRRVATSTFTDYSLNDGYAGACLAADSNVYIPYVKINIPEVFPTYQGSSLKNSIRKIHIFRADLSRKTVLANGIGVLGIEGSVSGVSTKFNGYRNASVGSSDTIVDHACTVSSNITDPLLTCTYGSFPFIADDYGTTFDGSFLMSTLKMYKVDGFSTAPLFGPIKNRKFVEFYSQDHLLSNERIDSLPTDKIINFGHYDNYYKKFSNPSSYTNYMAFGSMRFNASDVPEVNNLDNSILCGPVNWIEEGGNIKVANGDNDYYSKKWLTSWNNNTTPYYTYRQWNVRPKGYLFISDSNVNPIGINPSRDIDYGCHMISYYRPLTAEQQYGNKSIARIIPTGAFYDVQSDETQFGPASPQLSISVFGGDTFTTNSLLRFSYTPSYNKQFVGGAIPYSTTSTTDGGRYGVGIEFYSQSRVNPQIRYNTQEADTNKTNFVWPFNFTNPKSPSKFYKWWTGDNSVDLIEEIAYNSSYSDKNQINSLPIFDPDAIYDGRLGASVFYSEPKLQESKSDSYSYIKATNRKDLDITDGTINHMEIFNGELITFQDRSVQRQYFNSTTMLANADAQIILGDGGAVLSRRGMVLSTDGLTNKWSAVKGRDLYWFSGINKKIMKLGSNGISPISTSGKIDSFLQKFARLSHLYDNPANGNGVCGVWDESYGFMIMTFSSKRDVVKWAPNTYYPEGAIVSYSGSEYFDWHRTGEFYLNMVDNNNLTPSEASDSNWIHIPHNNSDYYNEFTIVYNEEKNKFICFLSPRPKIYIPYKDTYLTPRPINPGSAIFEHGVGVECVWYSMDQYDPIADSTALKEDAYIEGIINVQPEVIKKAEAIAISANHSPYSVEITTSAHKTIISESDFETREGTYVSTVKNTIDDNNSSEADESRVFGRWIKVKYVMPFGIRRTLRTFILKVVPRNRLFNK